MSLGRAKVAVLGAGRAGSALHAALAEHDARLVLLWSRSESTAAAARQEGFPATSGPLTAGLGDAELVFLAVADSAVGPLAGELASRRLVRKGAVVAHLAGSLDLKPLQPLAADASLGSLHPLVPIASRHATFAGATCAVEASDVRAAARLEAVASALGMNVVRPRGDRARYHAAACLVGNYPQVLMEAALVLLSQAGLSRDEARRALGPLLRAAAENAATREGVASLSGPVVRGDTAVVERHLAAMNHDPRLAKVLALYRAGAAVAADLVGERADEIAKLVEPAPDT